MYFPSDSLIEMVPSDSGDDTTSRNDRIAGMNQAPDSDSSDKSSSSASSRVRKK